MALGREKVTEWALPAPQACQSLGVRLNPSHLQEQELKEEILGDAGDWSNPETTAAMLKIRAFVPRKVDVIKAGSQEKSPFDKSQISSKGILK